MFTQYFGYHLFDIFKTLIDYLKNRYGTIDQDSTLFCLNVILVNMNNL